MKDYSLDKYDFKKYLLTELQDARQEELIFWKKTIPMPVDMVYDIFEKRGDLLNKYIHHIGAACLFAFSLQKEGRDWKTELDKQPTKNNIADMQTLIQMFKKYFHDSNILNMLKELADVFLLSGFVANETMLAYALCHQGKKYNRMYIPSELRTVILKYFPDIFESIAISNGDMFSNVVADELKVYRMGFADAFSGMFNKLIDFILDHSTPGSVSYASASDIKLLELREDSAQYSKASYGRVSDGSMWEPVYKNSKHSFVLNSSHPFCDLVKGKGTNAEGVFTDIIEILAEIESETIRDSDKKMIEILRQDLSRRLRLKAEEKQSS